MVHGDALIGFAADRLADDTPLDRAVYAALLPLGKLQNLALQLQDIWQTYQYIHVTDPNSHLSRTGWVFYDEALDAFFHDQLDVLAATEWSPGVAVSPESAQTDLATR
jgi:hypothetical protein